jgi:hypothetical protein
MLLALSFLALGAFGSLLLAPNDDVRRLSMLGPCSQPGYGLSGADLQGTIYAVEWSAGCH